MLAMSKIIPESRDYDFWTNLAKTKFRSLQVPIVLMIARTFLFVTKIAGIFGPIKIIASICGPVLYIADREDKHIELFLGCDQVL